MSNFTLEDQQITSSYTPHENQLPLHLDRTRHRILACGRRFGKTTFALNELSLQAWNCKNPLWLNWYIAPTYRQAKLIAWRSIFEYLPECLIEKENESELQITLINKNIIELKGADNEDSLRGIPLNFAILDEYATMKSNVWKEIIQPSMADTKGRACFIGTPKGFNHLYDLYCMGLQGSKEHHRDFKSYRKQTLDNPYIDPQEIEEIRLVTDERIFRQEYEASFEHFTGAIYPDFHREKHVIEPYAIPGSWEFVLSMDYGYRNKTGVLFGSVDYDGNLVIYAEIYEAGRSVSELAQEMRMVANPERLAGCYVDPSAIAIATEFQDYGWSFSPAKFADKSPKREVEAGINRVTEYLKSGRLKIFNTCQKLIWELERYRWSETTFGEDGDYKPIPFKKDDHLCDALRYMIMSRPSAPSAERREEMHRKDKMNQLDARSKMFWTDFMKEKDQLERGGGYIDQMGVLSDTTGWNNT